MADEPEPSALEQRIRADIAELGELTGAQASLAELAYTLCALLIKPGAMGGAALARELRETLKAIFEEADLDDDSAAFVEGLSAPVHGSSGPGVPAPVGDAAESGPGDARPKGRGGRPAAGDAADAVAAVRRGRGAGDRS